MDEYFELPSSEAPFEFISRCHASHLLFQGVVDVLCEACEQLKWKVPSKIQREAVPVALAGM